MPVKLHCAFENKSEELRFIFERLEKSKKFYCPHCHEEVFAKKGPIREHHFAHKPNTECSATFETILHFEAKHYIAKQIKNQEGQELLFAFNLGKHIPAIATMYSAINIMESSNISLHNIMSFYKLSKAHIEYKIPGSKYIADVLGTGENGQQILVIEIFYAHESTEEKVNFIKDKDIPFLEVIPSYADNGQIRFELHTYHLPDFFEQYKEKVDNAVIKQIYPLYEKDLKEKAAKEQEQYEVLKFKLSAVQALKNDLSKDSFYSELLKSLDRSSKTTRVLSYFSNAHQKDTLEGIEYRKKGQNRFLIGKTTKGSYIIKKEKNVLYTMINKLLQQINISALIEVAEKEYIVGFDLEIPPPSNLSDTLMNSVLDKLEDYERRFKNKIESKK